MAYMEDEYGKEVYNYGYNAKSLFDNRRIREE